MLRVQKIDEDFINDYYITVGKKNIKCDTDVNTQPDMCLSPVTCSTKKLVMASPDDRMAEHPHGEPGFNFLFTYR